MLLKIWNCIASMTLTSCKTASILYLLFYFFMSRSGFFWWRQAGNLGCRRFAACDCWTQTLLAGNAVHWHCIVSNLKKGDVATPEKISADDHGPGYLQTSAHPQVVATIDVMFRKIFELWWFDKRHVEMDSIWFWRWLWWFLFVWYLNKYWLLLQDDNCNCATPLSLVVIVKFSVNATCALY